MLLTFYCYILIDILLRCMLNMEYFWFFQCPLRTEEGCGQFKRFVRFDDITVELVVASSKDSSDSMTFEVSEGSYGGACDIVKRKIVFATKSSLLWNFSHVSVSTFDDVYCVRPFSRPKKSCRLGPCPTSYDLQRPKKSCRLGPCPTSYVLHFLLLLFKL